MNKTPSPVPEQSVVGINSYSDAIAKGTVDTRAINFGKELIFQKHYACLGSYSFETPRVLTPQELTKMTAQKGGDYYIYCFSPAGTRTGTRMVMTGFTTPSMITTTSQSSAYGTYNGSYQNNYGGYGTINGNANAYGYGSSQTYIPGSQTFQAQPYSYQAMGNVVMVFATPQQQWKLIKDGVISTSIYTQP